MYSCIPKGVKCWITLKTEFKKSAQTSYDHANKSYFFAGSFWKFRKNHFLMWKRNDPYGQNFDPKTKLQPSSTYLSLVETFLRFENSLFSE